MRLFEREVLSDDRRRDVLRAPLAHVVPPDAIVSYFEIVDDENAGPRRFRVLVVHGGHSDANGQAFVYDGEQLREGAFHEHAEENHAGVVELPRGDGTCDIVGLTVGPSP